MSTPNLPAGSPCKRCVVRPARLNRQWPHLATEFCSDQCKRAWSREHGTQARYTDLANDVRVLLGLPAGRSKHFTVKELEAIRRRLRRFLPYEGMAMHPARHRKREAA